MTAHRPTVAGTRHVVSSTHYLATTAGFAILEAGGNAVDAGCAAGIALGVLQSDIVGVAGVAPIMLYMAETRKVVTLAGLGGWPRRLDPQLFMREHDGKIPPGLLRTVIPAAPDAWITALKRHGTMSFGEVAAAAIRFARDGFPMYRLMTEFLTENRGNYERWASNAALYLPGGKVPQPGELFRQVEMGATLQYMADQEKTAAKRGREEGLEAARLAFYRGDIAQKMVAFHKAEGGLLREDDLAEYQTPYEPAQQISWNGLDVYTCGPWCQGPVLLQALKLLDGDRLKAAGHNSPAYIHAVTEALKLAFADREHYYGDPNFIDVPMQALLSDAYNDSRRRLIDDARAAPEMPAPGTIEGKVPGGRLTERIESPPRAEADTSYVCVVDRHGNVMSATPSDGSFASQVIPGLGIVPSQRGSQSRADPAHPCGVAPGKRPRLTPNPAMAIRDGKAFMPFGTPGGDVQSQAMLQVLLNVELFGMPMQDAIEAPRFATYSFPSSFAPFDYHPGRLNLERRFDDKTAAALTGLGHKIHFWPEWTWLAGGMCAIRMDRESGMFEAGADPRRASYAIGW